VIKRTNSSCSAEQARRCRTYGDYLYTLAGSKGDSASSASGLDLEVIQEFASLAFPSPLPPPKSKTESAMKAIRGRLMSAFAKLARHPEDHGALIDIVIAIEADTTARMSPEMLQEAHDALERILKAVSSRKGTTSVTSEQSASYRIALLDAAALLQLYNEEPDAVEVLRDLKAYQAKAQHTGHEQEINAGSSTSVVEVMLAMLAQPSSLMRQITLQVFESLTETIDSQALGLLTDVLQAEENDKGQRALFNLEGLDGDDSIDEDGEGIDEPSGNDTSEEEDDDNAGDDDLVLEGIELINGHEAPSEDEEEPSDSGDEEAPKDLEDLDNQLEKILGSHRLDKDAEAASSSSDSEMTDSEMLELDETLAQAFKSRVKHHSQKKEKKDARETVVNFKHRVLDLLAVFVRKEAGTNPLSFTVLLPLLQLIRTTTAKPLVQKAADTMTDFAKNVKKARSDGGDVKGVTDDTDLIKLLSEIHQEATRDASHVFVKAASSASLAIASQLFAADEKNLDNIFTVYTKTQKDWALGRLRLQPAFSLDWHNWLQGHAATASWSAAKSASVAAET
jgi:DNA polymerase phi